MKAQFSLFSFIFLAFGIAQSQSLRDSPENFSMAGTEQKIEAMREVGQSVAQNLRSGPTSSRSPSSDSNSDIQLLEKGLIDSNAEVRTEALRGVSLLALASSASPNNAPANLDALQKPLASMFENPDGDLRAASIQAYSKLFEIPASVEADLLAQYGSETSPIARKAILNSILAKSPPSENSLEFVITQLQIAENSYDAAMAILSNINPPPKDALGPMFEQFSTSTDVGKRDLLARAVQRYGNLALSYEPQLKEMLFDEKDPVVKNNLKVAIENLAEPPKDPVSTKLAPKSSDPAESASPPINSEKKFPSRPVAVDETEPTSTFPIIPVAVIAALLVAGVVFFLRRKTP